MIDWWTSMTVIQQFFAAVAIPATLVLIVQIVLSVIGATGSGPDADVDADGLPDNLPDDADSLDGYDSAPEADVDGVHEGPDPGLKVFTVRGIVAFFAIFGWSGLALMSGGTAAGVAIALAIAFGALAMVLIALLFRAMLGLQYDGTVDINNARGLSGSVYLTVPAERSGQGKVTIVIQERFSEFDAVTDASSPLPTGSEVIVVGVSGKNTLVVTPKKQ